MKRAVSSIFSPAVFILFIACFSAPQVEQSVQSTGPEEFFAPVKTIEVTEPAQSRPEQISPIKEAEHVFDPHTISNERYLATKSDIQAIVVELNRIIRARNYNAWLGYLSDSYLVLLSSRDFLDEKTEDLYRRDQIVAANTGKNPRAVEKRQMLTARDYFDNVVVPSRSNDRVDDIAFISETRVRAYTVDSRGSRLILYDLAIVGERWKIVS
jgi:hypothetical protein